MGTTIFSYKIHFLVNCHIEALDAVLIVLGAEVLEELRSCEESPSYPVSYPVSKPLEAST